MPIIHVAKPFMLKDDNHQLTEFKVGRYDVDLATAEHWYVKAHLEGFVEPPPRVGTEQQAVLLAAQAARLNEPVPDAPQPVGPTPATTKAAPEIVFAGRRGGVPKEPDTMPSFVDPRTK